MNNMIKFESGTTVEQAATLLGIDEWYPVKQQCLDKYSKPIYGLYYLENSKTENVISSKSVGKVYKASSHLGMLSFFTALLENSAGLSLDSGFVIEPGTHILLQCKWNKELEVTENQIINPSLVYVLDHSSLGSNKILQIGNCLWCSNQLPTLNNRSNMITIRHNKNQEYIIKQATKTYENLEQELEENLADYRLWSKTYITKDTFDNLVNSLLNVGDAKYDSPRLYQQLEHKYYNGVENKGKTLWDFVNCVTEQLRDLNYKTITSKVKSQLLGGSYNRAFKAAQLAKQYVGVNV